MHPSSSNVPRKPNANGALRCLVIGAATALILLQGCASHPPAPPPGEAAHAEAKAAYLANDYQRTLGIVEPLAVGGEAWAQYTLGYMYYYGRGVAMDRQMAKQWIQRAAQQGYKPAQQALQRLSTSAPKHSNGEVMEPPEQTPSAPPGRAPMPVPPASPDASPAVPAPTPELPPGEAPMPTPAPETGDPAPTAPSGESSTATPRQDNTTNSGEKAAPANAAPQASSPPPSTQAPPSAVQIPANETRAPSAAPVPTALDNSAAKATQAGNGINGTGWIAAQDPMYYTVQLLGSSNQGAVLRFIRDHHLEQQAAYFAQRRNGQLWYTVVYGSFPDRPAARQALGRLPAAIDRASPWIRRFKDVQTRLGP